MKGSGAGTDTLFGTTRIEQMRADLLVIRS
jgi:hypothetical protein